MSRLSTWFYIVISVLVALAANSISAIWASKENKFSSPWLFALIVISPIVFITFGLVTSRLGLAMSSATIDVLLTATTILVGLFFFHEWGNVSVYQFIGITLAVIGIILMQLHK
ncbi:MAG: hypothetical protein Q8Q18_02675 [bacterium]|nr:hypothetical protein [bacterium]